MRRLNATKNKQNIIIIVCFASIIYSIFIMIFVFCVSSPAVAQTGYCENPEQENQSLVEETIEDETQLKQTEMRNPIVLIRTCQGNGSGTIIDCIQTDVDGVWEYRVLTNAHVTHTRFITIIRSVNSLTGKVEKEIIDTGCSIIFFDHTIRDWFQYDAVIVVEDIQYDLTLLSFQTTQELAVAKIATKNMLDRVRVFDEIFIIGCQLGCAPTPTIGIISQIITGNNGEKEWVIYSSTAQITPGSSGGGLFKKYDDHYYMIGIPFRVVITSNSQIIPHLSYAISVGVAEDFIDQNAVSYP